MVLYSGDFYSRLDDYIDSLTFDYGNLVNYFFEKLGDINILKIDISIFKRAYQDVYKRLKGYIENIEEAFREMDEDPDDYGLWEILLKDILEEFEDIVEALDKDNEWNDEREFNYKSNKWLKNLNEIYNEITKFINEIQKERLLNKTILFKEIFNEEYNEEWQELI